MPDYSKQFEEWGEPTVRDKLSKGLLGSDKSQAATRWLERDDVKRARQRDDRAEHREETRDELARKTARDAKVLAWFSIAIAIIGLLIGLFRG